MKTDKPILFSGPMVRAILGGRKTQTRRVVKPQPDSAAFGGKPYWNIGGLRLDSDARKPLKCPYGQPGGLLWVRESYWINKSKFFAAYCGGDCPEYEIIDAGYKKRPSIHMPRAASRLTLEITGIRVERLQDISEHDALAEGIEPKGFSSCEEYNKTHETPSLQFQALWQSINGPDSWDADPWVWVVEFKPHQMNIDDYLKTQEKPNDRSRTGT